MQLSVAFLAVAVGMGVLFAGRSAAADGQLPEAIKSFEKPYPTFGSVERLDPAMDQLVPPDAELRKLAEGFEWSEGPVWVRDGGYLLFSDIPRNTIFKWEPGQGISQFMKPSGYTGSRDDLREPGSNGLVIDAQGRLVLAEHGDRRIARLKSLDQPNGEKTTLAAAYQDKRLNSPNDLAIHSSGDIYFTDPPYGLPKNVDDPAKELDFQGVYRLSSDGKLTLLTKDLARPNGIAFSPDEKTLYVANSHGPRPIWMAYDVTPSGGIANGRVFFDATKLRADGRSGGNDGMAVDQHGNLFATGPGGVLVLSPEGKHLGTIMTGVPTANCTFGGEDGSTLYITADMYLARIKLNTKGARFVEGSGSDGADG